MSENADLYSQAQSDARYIPSAEIPATANFRMKNDEELQLAETSPSAGFASLWIEGGALKVGPLDQS